MIENDMNGDDAFVERIAKQLRAPERVPADMEARVMADVRRVRDQLHAQGLNKPWLLRPRTYSA